jgi:Tfp pilus assembly protein PilO
MKRYWLFLVVVVFAAVAAGAERLSALYMQGLKAQQDDLRQVFDQLEARVTRAPKERAQCEIMRRASNNVFSQIRWESDSTRLLHWYEEAATKTGVRLVNSRMVSADHNTGSVAGGAFGRMRFNVQVQGPFWSLAKYVERVERSPTPMVVETLTLSADREHPGAGDMTLAVSCLSPMKKTDAARQGEGK